MSVVHIVHCIDAEGPLYESVEATFQRIRNTFSIEIELEPTQENLIRMQNKEIDLNGAEEIVSKMIRPHLLQYNDTWDKLDEMLAVILSQPYRCKTLDSFGNGWIYNWFCVDHVGYEANPRCRDLGYHNIFDHYKDILSATDSVNDGLHFHYHPMPFNRQAHCMGTHYFAHSDTLYQILARRIIDRNWFPCAYRPGFHVIRPDSNWFLEQYIPFDFSNQACDEISSQPDLREGRFGDWRRAPKYWQPYHPGHDDYQIPGRNRRWILRCLNIGTRHSCITQKDINQAFYEAAQGKPVVLAFTNHDFRNMKPDIENVRKMLAVSVKQYPDVKYRFCEAKEAVRLALNLGKKPPFRLHMEIKDNCLHIRSDTPIFGPQPFFAMKTSTKEYFHDNLDFQQLHREWTYIFDHHTFPLSMVEAAGVGACDDTGNIAVTVLDLKTLKTIKNVPINQPA